MRRICNSRHNQTIKTEFTEKRDEQCAIEREWVVQLTEEEDLPASPVGTQSREKREETRKDAHRSL